MANIHYPYKNAKHTIDSFDNIIHTYNWILGALKNLFTNRDDVDFDCYVEFKSGDMSYKCNSFDEFKKYAFGKNITPITLDILIVQKYVGVIASIFAPYDKWADMQEFTISVKEELMLANIIEALSKNEKVTEPVVMNYQDNSIHIGDNNNVANSDIRLNNTLEITFTKPSAEKKKDKWYYKSFWQIVVPIAVTVIAAVLCAWLKLC